MLNSNLFAFTERLSCSCEANESGDETEMEFRLECSEFAMHENNCTEADNTL